MSCEGNMSTLGILTDQLLWCRRGQGRKGEPRGDRDLHELSIFCPCAGRLPFHILLAAPCSEPPVRTAMLTTGSHPRLKLVVFGVSVYGICELLRLRAFRKERARLAADRTELSPDFPYEEWRTFFIKRILREAEFNGPKAREFIENVFWGRPLEKLGRGDIQDWLTMFMTCTEECDGKWQQRDLTLADQTCRKLESLLHHRFLDSTCRHPFIRINHPVTNHTPARPIFQPLPLQLFRHCIRTAASVSFKLLGFEQRVDEDSGVRFWVHRLRGEPGRPVGAEGGHGGEEEGKVRKGCLVLIPGMGMGAVPYLPFIHLLKEHRSDLHHEYLVVTEPPLISMHPRPSKTGTPSPSFPRSDQIIQAFATLLRDLGLEKADFLGHSYGGIILTYLSNDKEAQHMVNRAVFMETPVFLSNSTMHWPTIFRVYRYRDLITKLCAGDVQGYFGAMAFSEQFHQHLIHNVRFVNIKTRKPPPPLSLSRSLVLRPYPCVFSSLTAPLCSACRPSGSSSTATERDLSWTGASSSSPRTTSTWTTSRCAHTCPTTGGRTNM